MDEQRAAESGRDINRAAVIGAGTMGRQIASLIANSGRDVAITDAFAPARDTALELIGNELAFLPNAPRYAHHQFKLRPEADHASLMSRIRVAESIESAVEGAEIVIEAVREDLETKRGVFTQLSRLAPDAVLATNSSSLPSSLLTTAVHDPGRLLNMHFFAPIWSRAMVEIMGCGETRPEVLDTARDFGQSLNLVVAVVRGESKGFIINRIWRAVKREALRVVDEDHADPEDVDRLWMIFFGTPVGPFGTMDMVGLDVVSDIETSYQQVATDPADLPSAILRQKLDANQLGEKSGQGFYAHPDPEYLRPGWLRGEDE